MSGPHFNFEQEYSDLGHTCIAGVDEVGMGCLAGPVVSAAVILDPKRIPKGVDDSKKLTALKRERLNLEIRETAIAFAIAQASVEEIDTLNIYHAARLAMKRAVLALSRPADSLLIDGRGTLDLNIPYKFIVKGDSISVSIASASVLAKVFRDALMKQMDDVYPGYGFAGHKGYGSVTHRQNLQNLGRSPIHRKSFSWTPV